MHIVRPWHMALLFSGMLSAAAIAVAAEEPAQAAAEPSELEALREEVKRLRETQSGPCYTTGDHEPPPAGGVEGGTLKYLLKARWDRLERGMEKDEVRVLLGWPSTVTRSAAGQVEIWGYGNPQTNRYGVGTIYFDDDEEVSTWLSPTFKTR